MKTPAIRHYLLKQALLITLPVILIVGIGLFAAERIYKQDRLGNEVQEISRHFHALFRLINENMLKHGDRQVAETSRNVSEHITESFSELQKTCMEMVEQCHLLNEILPVWQLLEKESELLTASILKNPTDPHNHRLYEQLIASLETLFLKLEIFAEQIDRQSQGIKMATWVTMLSVLLLVVISMLIGFRNIYRSLASPLHSLVETLNHVTNDKAHLEHSLKQFLELDIRWFIGNAKHQSQEMNDLIAVFRQMTHRLLEMLSEQHLVEEELIDARDSAQKASMAKSQFLANVSHEIRTPMNAIIGMSHLVQETRLDDLQKNYIEKINLSATRLLSILNDILDYSRIEAGRMRIDYSDFRIEDVMHMASMNIEKTAAQKHQNLEINLSEDVPLAYIGDSARLVKIITSLGDNAVKFTPSEGRVTINVNLQEESSRTAVLLFEVRDNGVGMTQEQQTDLFKPFTQGDGSSTRRFGGTGLGLVIAKTLVEMMNGKIWYDSEFGKGTCFYFTVEIVKQHGNLSERVVFFDNNTQAPQQIKQLKDFQLLLVEDNETFRQQLLDMLSGNGMRVRAVGSSEECLDVLKKNDFDGVILDCEMPDIDGFTMSRSIRRLPGLAKMPIIGMISSPLVNHKQQAAAAGLNGTITKPVNIDELFTILANILNPDGLQQTSVPTEEVDEDLLALKGFNILNALERVDGDQKKMYAMLNNFALDFVNFEKEFNAALMDPDSAAAERAIFSLKIRATELGLEKLKNSSGLLELACREEGEQVQLQLIDVLQQLHQALHEIEKLQQRRADPQHANTGDQATLESFICNLYNYLQNDNTQAVDVIRSLEYRAGLVDHQQEWKTLRQAVEGYRFEEALEKLKALCEQLDIHPESIDC